MYLYEYAGEWRMGFETRLVFRGGRSRRRKKRGRERREERDIGILENIRNKLCRKR